MSAGQNSLRSYVGRWFRPLLRSLDWQNEVVRRSRPGPADETPPPAAVAAENSGPFISHADRVFGLDHLFSIDPSARLTVLDVDAGSRSTIRLGRGVYIGRQVELAAAGGGSVHVDDDTSIQDASMIFGHVIIGAHCLFGKYVFIASRGHHFQDRPAWLIRDQDRLMLAHLPPALELQKSLIRIEDDCWVGQSVFISPGVYVGRGAVIGTNAVVTTDVGPYEVHGGVPSRKIRSRLAFQPPLLVDALQEASIPYFYRGFRLSQESLAGSRRHGIVEARAQSCLVMAPGPGSRLKLTGTRLDQVGTLQLYLRVNGTDCGRHPLAPGPFEIAVDVPAAASETDESIPPPLRSSTYVEIEMSPSGDSPARYGIKAAALSH